MVRQRTTLQLLDRKWYRVGWSGHTPWEVSTQWASLPTSIPPRWHSALQPPCFLQQTFSFHGPELSLPDSRFASPPPSLLAEPFLCLQVEKCSSMQIPAPAPICEDQWLPESSPPRPLGPPCPLKRHQASWWLHMAFLGTGHSVLLSCNKKYIFGLHPGSWHRASKTLEISRGERSIFYS